MMSVKRFLLLLFLVISIVSCNRGVSRLQLSLQRSGENRHELEKVLNYYSQYQKDSLKLKAAKYLIENLPGHLSFSSDKFFAYQDSIGELLNQKASDEEIFNLINNFHFTNDIIKADIEIITSDVLIRNIEMAFDVWHTKPWCRHLNFNEFCEYILPYKYSELQVLDHWRDSLEVKYNKSINAVHLNDETLHSTYHIGKLINREVNDKIQIKLDEGRVNQSPFLRADLLTKMPFGSCNEYAALILATMRSHGVAACIDFVPQWGHRHGGNHKWITILNNNGKHLPIPHLHQNPGDVFFPMHILPKIYRQTYAPIPEREEYMLKTNYRFNPLTQFHKDVTSEYTTTSDLTIPIQQAASVADDYVYIACSSYRDWNIVDFGYKKGNKAYFKQMGRNVVYMILGFNGQNLIPVSEPFVLTKDGDIHYLTPNPQKKNEITLWRKFLKSEWVAHVESRMIRARVQATNDESLKSWDTLYEIEDLKYPDRIPINTDTKYRYWRFLGRPYAYMNIAEFHLYDGNNNLLVTGDVIGSEGMLHNDSVYSHSKAFDGNWFTYYHSPQPSNDNWVGLDLITPQEIRYVRCVPRSDDNGIHYGDMYELVYWGDNKWRSLGSKVATEKFLKFDSVPENALLLLKNLSQGREERIFTIEDGKQIWR